MSHSDSIDVPAPRRVLATRNARWAGALAHELGRRGIRPNAVSLASIVFAAIAGAAYLRVPNADGYAVVYLLVAAASIQLRLLCNLLDGMLAVEEGLQSATGSLYNDIPDRVADIIILVAAGYSASLLVYSVALGWLAALLAVFTAYVRLLGGSLGQRQHFIGPMAKQHRMFVMTIATVAAAVEASVGSQGQSIRVGLVLVVVGSLVTSLRRTAHIAAELTSP